MRLYIEWLLPDAGFRLSKSRENSESHTRQLGVCSNKLGHCLLKPALSSQVRFEVDETYIGGVRHGKRGRGAEGKVAVVGVVQRRGKVMATAVSNVKRSTLVPFITKNVASDAVLYTDEFPSYDHITRFGYRHKRIQHSAKVYVSGQVHVNNIENFWSLVKRGISGVYHAVSPKYLQSYLNEYAFRYNHRNDETPMFELFLNRIQVS